MNVEKIRVLLVEDNATDALLVEDELAHTAGTPFFVVRVEQLNEALTQLGAQCFDVVLLDLSLPDSHGFETFVRLHDAAPEIPIVVLSGRADGQLAVQAVQAGAQDYLVKGRLGEDVLPRSIRYAIERQRSERTLAESEERYRLLIEQSPDGYLVHCDGEIVFANATSLKLFGADRREQLLGRSIMESIAPEFRDIVRQRISNAQANESNPPMEIMGIRLDGMTATVEASSHPFIHEGRPAVQVVLRDITKRKRAEERVREQAAMLNHAHDAIIVRDIYTRRITFWNQGAERLYGWTADEAEGRDIGELIFVDPNAPDIVTDELLKAGESRGEYRQMTKAGKELTISGHTTLVRDSEGAPKSALVINIDVTAQKELEARFLRSQRMESIGTLAGGIAHDLNNTLSPIIMSIELLKMKFTDPASHELLAIISSSARRGADMVRQVLSFARGVEGRRMEVQVKHLVDEIEKIANDTFLKHIQVRTIIPHDLWTVLGDPTQLHQVLLNLCVNARDAMPDGGTLTISAENLTLDAHYAGLSLNLEAKPGPYVFLQVKDSGAGMPPAIMEKIFDPFFTTKGVGKGTGLGLSTSLGIVKSHGGFIRVYSDMGKGTTFKVYLPALTEISPAAAAELAAEMPRGNGELILVVDDEAAVREITLHTLQAFGYRVVLAADGAEAVAVFAQQGAEIAVVLTDMTMPIMDGPATIRALRRLNPAVRIIGASGLSSDGHAASLDVKYFLPKPYTAETLLKVLKQVLSAEA